MANQDPYQQQGQQQGKYSFGGAKQAVNQQAKDAASGALDNLEKEAENRFGDAFGGGQGNQGNQQ